MTWSFGFFPKMNHSLLITWKLGGHTYLKNNLTIQQMKILGISAFYHDSAACLFQDGHIIAAAQEERFSRIKHDAAFPSQAVRFCLEVGDTTIDQLDAIVFYDKPLLKFERLLETYYSFAPKGIRSFAKAIPVWLREKLFLKDLIYKALKEIAPFDKKQVQLLFSEHHLSHAASAFYPSNFDEAAILTIDGVGEWATASIAHGKGTEITTIKELHFPHSLGLLYSAFTYYIGFKVNNGEYKLMGLAPYGNPHSKETQRFIELIKSHLVTIKSDGSIFLNQQYFNYATGLTMTKSKRWASLFGIPQRMPESEFTQAHCNLAYAIQNVTEEIVLKMAKEAKRLTNSKNLCLAGGVALNCVANGKLLKSNFFENIFIQPAAGDAGGALGCALAVYYQYFQKERTTTTERDTMQGAYLGRAFHTYEVEQMAKKQKANYQCIENFDELCKLTAKLIADGNVIGWMQDRMEFGPRALGNRSILADPRNVEMQQKVNLKIKFRESFRPFAPSVLAEDLSEYFEMKQSSPYMLFTANISQKHRQPLPINYVQLPIKDKLQTPRSSFQAITHVDFSARIQTVHQDTNPKYWQLINTFKQLTGCGLLLNTSFNVRGEPIVCTPEDAYHCFQKTDMDYLIIGNYLFKK